MNALSGAGGEKHWKETRVNVNSRFVKNKNSRDSRRWNNSDINDKAATPDRTEGEGEWTSQPWADIVSGRDSFVQSMRGIFSGSPLISQDSWGFIRTRGTPGTRRGNGVSQHRGRGAYRSESAEGRGLWTPRGCVLQNKMRCMHDCAGVRRSEGHPDRRTS